MVTDLGGNSVNKRKLKVGVLLLICCLSVKLSLPAGQGGEGEGWAGMEERVSEGEYSFCADFRS